MLRFIHSWSSAALKVNILPSGDHSATDSGALFSVSRTFSPVASSMT